MNIRSSMAIAGMALAAAAAAASAQDSTTIDIAGHRVPVLKGGLYDRYRSNPPLSVVQQEAPDVDLGWFRTLKMLRYEYVPQFQSALYAPRPLADLSSAP